MPDCAEETLRESQTLHHSLIQQLPVGIFRKDAAGRYVLVNAEFCRLQGQPAEYFLGRTPREIASHAPVKTIRLRQPKELHFLQLGADHHEHILRTGQTIYALPKRLDVFAAQGGSDWVI